MLFLISSLFFGLLYGTYYNNFIVIVFGNVPITSISKVMEEGVLVLHTNTQPIFIRYNKAVIIYLISALNHMHTKKNGIFPVR